MNVKVRYRNQGGKTSIYLDYYGDGKRRTEYLKLYLNPNPTTKEEKEANKKTENLAKAICATRQIEIQNGIHGFRDLEKQKASFLSYVEILSNQRQESPGNHGNWKSMLKHLKAFCSHDISFSEVDRQFVQAFKDFLEKKAIAHGNQKLAQNSMHSYFNKLKAALKQAVKDGIILTNPAEGLEGFKQTEPEIEFLTEEEVNAAIQVDCEMPQLKTAFLFSCHTGLRWSDIEKLIWSEVQFSNELGHFIRFRQKKTKDTQTLPISAQAFDLLGERKAPDEKVFKGLKYSDGNNKKLHQWIQRAGIGKTITFHCARHTCATLLLTMGADIYTVSKILGHKYLKTSEIYAKIIDTKKREAVNMIKLNYNK